VQAVPWAFTTPWRDDMQSTTTTRRRLLTTLAAGTAAAATGRPAISGENDPVFAAITRHRQTYHAWSEALSAERRQWPTTVRAAERAGDEHYRATDALLDEALPTTLAGVAALMRHVADLYAIDMDRGGAITNAFEDALPDRVATALESIQARAGT
jgi:hypothetical protein